VVDLVPEQPQAGDIYVLCSDGLSGMLKDESIRDLVTNNKDDMKAAAKALIDGANDNGGEDNVTVVLLKVE
jgi:PPM family protein phosphatase